MIQPLTLALWARRNVPYVEVWTLTDGQSGSEVAGNPLDLTGWTAALQVRLYGLAAGSALISLATVTTDVQGLRILDAAAGQLAVRIDETSINNLPAAPRTGGNATFAYDLVLTDPTGLEQTYATGDFIVYPGVTR